jgi:hypothetical protein
MKAFGYLCLCARMRECFHTSYSHVVIRKSKKFCVSISREYMILFIAFNTRLVRASSRTKKMDVYTFDRFLTFCALFS